MATFEVWGFVLSLGHLCLVFFFLNTDVARGQAGD